MANSLLNGTNGHDMWKEVKKITNSKVPLPNTVDYVTGSENVSNMWKKHFNELFNCVKSDDINSINDIKYDKSLIVNWREVKDAIKDIPCGKAAGHDSISAEHFKYCGDNISILLSMLFTACFIHGYMPTEMTKSVLVPIIKDKAGDLGAKNNYRPIGLNPVSSKLFECVILNRMESHLSTTPNQFGFKQKHATDTCIFLFKELLQYFKTLVLLHLCVLWMLLRLLIKSIMENY